MITKTVTVLNPKADILNFISQISNPIDRIRLQGRLEGLTSKEISEQEVVIDETDAVFDPRREVNYPIGVNRALVSDELTIDQLTQTSKLDAEYTQILVAEMKNNEEKISLYTSQLGQMKVQNIHSSDKPTQIQDLEGDIEVLKSRNLEIVTMIMNGLEKKKLP